MFKTERVSDTTIIVRVPFKRKKSWEQWMLFTSDEHHDNPKCNRKLLKKHYEQAKERNAMIISNGDFFCAMQGKYDPRSSKKDIRPENQVTDYLDSLVDEAEKMLLKYRKNIVVMSRGNHELSILRRQETDLIGRLVKRLQSKGSPVEAAGFRGWVKLCFLGGGSKRGLKIYRTHGGGGNSPVTKGVLNAPRRAAIYPDADIIITGHIHEKWDWDITRSRISDKGIEYVDEQVHIQTSTYKEEYFGTESGYHNENERPPKPLGGYWVRFYYDAEVDRIRFERFKAK